MALPIEAVRHNVAVIGPPGSGKTHNIIVPWVIAGLQAGFSVVAVDVLGNLKARVRGECTRRGLRLGVPTYTLDYTRPQGSASWNWLAEIDSDMAIGNAIRSVLGDTAPSGTDPFFYQSDSNILRGLLEIVWYSRTVRRWSTGDLLAWLASPASLISALNSAPNSPASGRLQSLLGLDDYDFTKRVMGLTSKLDVLANPSVAAVTTRHHMPTAAVLSRQQFVSVVAPLHHGQMSQMLSSLYLNSLIYRSFEGIGQPGRQPLLLILDEAAQMKDRIDFANILSTARGAGVAIVLAVQDGMQFDDEKQRSTIFSNCATLVEFAGVPYASAELMVKRLGDHQVQVSSVSAGPSGPTGRVGRTETLSTSTVPVLNHREIMAPPFEGRTATVHARDLSNRPFVVGFD